jgi:TonB family protein
MVNRIGRYEIQAELGRGGFGHVFRAFDPTMGSTVAIKTLIGGGEPDLLIRFRNEAAAARKLQHKNIITVYDFGEEDGVPYIVMELLDGEDLDRAIRNGRPLTILQKMRIMSEVSDGLQYAHSRGVIHRDVKPANIMLLSDGSVKIMDFGIALVTQATGQRLTPKGTIMGSFRFMAPEQFEGLPSDALCDIFAFGVIYYQFLTGKHPFDSPEAAAVMRNIIRAEPRPIREICPDCPAPLEQIVLRLLQKDRDLRYQSLEDAQFDVEPILLDLEKTHAADLLVCARDLVARAQMDTAQVLVREILRVDPGNAGARELREILQQQAQKKAVRARVEALLKTGQEKMLQEDYGSAIESFESALRADRSNPEIQDLIERARAGLEQAERARFLLDAARRALDAGNLTGAYNSATEALQLDPRNPNAAVLLEAIRRELAVREREQKLQEGIGRAKGFLVLQAFDEAITLLLQLQSDYPDASEVAELLARVRLEKSVQERRQRLLAGIGAGKDLLRNKRLADAAQVFEQLAREFPETAEVRDLLSYAREELTAQHRAEAVKRSSEEARALLQSQEFDRAIETLKQALRSFPGEDSLSHLLQSALSGKAECDRRKALAEALHSSHALVAEQRYEEALQRISVFISQYGSDPTLNDLRKRAQAEWALQRRIEAIGGLMGEARHLIEQGRASTATRLLQEASARYPGEPQLASLLELAQTKLIEQQRAAVEQAVSEAEEFTKTFQFDRAVEVVEERLKKYPEHPALVRCLQATCLERSNYQEEKEKQEREQFIHSNLDAAQRLLDKGKVSEAISALQQARASYPNDERLRTALAAAEETFRLRECKQRLDALCKKIEVLLSTREFDPALAQVAAALTEFPGEASLLGLRRSAEHGKAAQAAECLAREERHRFIEATLAHVGRFEEAGARSHAIRILETALQKYPDAPEMASAVARVRAGLEEDARRAALEEQVAAIEARIADRKWNKAYESVRAGQRDLGADPAFDRLEKKIRQGEAAQAEDERRTVQALLSHISELERGDDLKAAIAAVEEGARRFPANSELAEARGRLAEEMARRERLDRIRDRAATIEQRLRNKDFPAAYALMEAARRDFPGESVFEQLSDRGKAEQRAYQLETACAGVRCALGAGNVQSARSLLIAGLRAFPGEASFKELQQELAGEESRLKKLDRAERLLTAGRIAKAERICQELLTLRPDDRNAAALLERIFASRTDQHQKTADVPRQWARWRSWKVALPAGTVVVALLAFGVIRMVRPGNVVTPLPLRPLPSGSHPPDQVNLAQNSAPGKKEGAADLAVPGPVQQVPEMPVPKTQEAAPKRDNGNQKPQEPPRRGRDRMEEQVAKGSSRPEPPVQAPAAPPPSMAPPAATAVQPPTPNPVNTEPVTVETPVEPNPPVAIKAQTGLPEATQEQPKDPTKTPVDAPRREPNSAEAAPPQSPTQAGDANKRGAELFGQRRYDEAIGSFDEAIRLKPGSATMHYNRGVAYYKLGRYQKAIEDFDKAIDLDPQYTNAIRYRDDARANLAAGIYQVGGGVLAPVITYRVGASYSQQARVAGRQGIVSLSFVVDERGHIKNIHVVKSLGLGLDEAAIKAVAQWQFKPGLRDGKPVKVEFTVSMEFSLAEERKPSRSVDR